MLNNYEKHKFYLSLYHIYEKNKREKYKYEVHKTIECKYCNEFLKGERRINVWQTTVI